MIVEGGHSKDPLGMQPGAIIFYWLLGIICEILFPRDRIKLLKSGLRLSVLSLVTLPLHAQDCEVDFPGSTITNYSSVCGVGGTDQLSIGKNIAIGDGDEFTFDAPVVIDIQGNMDVFAEGDGRIVIPLGVSVIVNGNLQLDHRNGACNSGNPCTLTVVVEGSLFVGGNLQNNLMTLVWEGMGVVEVRNTFENKSMACMQCGTTCPTFNVTDCKDNEPGCFTKICTIAGDSCAIDATPPVITNCPVNQVYSTGVGSCDAVVVWALPIALDNCKVASFTSTHNPGDTFPLGSTTVTYTAADDQGNTTTCSFQVDVVDNAPPVISNLPNDLVVSTALGSCSAVASWIPPTALDNCNVASFTNSHDPGDSFTLGITTVTYTAVDDFGSTSTYSFQVDVRDDITPVLTNCPSDILLDVTDCATAAVNWTAPTATDNCNIASLTSTHAPGEVFNLGITTVIYTATDDYGNNTSCSFQVELIDNTDPVITNCPADLVVAAGPDCNTAVSWASPTATDNCAVNSLTSSYQSGDLFPLGTTTVFYTATDQSGNSASCSFTITVEDQQPPQFLDCPADIIVPGFDPNDNQATVSWQEPTTDENCALSSLSSSHQPGSKFSEGQTIVTYTATDEAGNAQTCSFSIEVIGNNTPSGNDLSTQTNSSDPIQICLDASDPDGDVVSLQGVDYHQSLGTVDQIQPVPQCFMYTPALGVTGVVTLTATVCDDKDPAACAEVRITIDILQEDVDIYKAFSPNGDGINDVWIIGKIEQHPQNSVVIFDRWGSIIYEAKGYNNEDIVWDGIGSSRMSSSAVVPAGTYFYSISLHDAGSLKGYIELIK